ncbi:MAG TPA: c-type cytochrome [Steroidobacteraceae bacterium]|nr:c-type cytochrome [Steroidobacteraceae bacterium]
MKIKNVLSLLITGALVGTPAYAADLAAGKAKAEEICVDCHGDDGKGDDDSPDITLASLSTKEFVQAMQDYQSGKRTKNAKMGRAAKKLTAEDVANVAAYFATLK